MENVVRTWRALKAGMRRGLMLGVVEGGEEEGCRGVTGEAGARVLIRFSFARVNASAVAVGKGLIP